MNGKFYSVGIGPGDPELLTYKAARIIEKCDIVAVPKSGAKDNVALKIVEGHINGKTIVECDMPMTRDKDKLEEHHRAAAKQLAKFLDKGKTVAFLTLGDPSIYSTAMYVHKRIEAMGYEAFIVAGVPSFCAVAARLNISLCEGGEALHIIPASYNDLDSILQYSGNKILMKSGKSICEVRDLISEKNLDAMAVECCGMENEKVHFSLDSIDENSSYFMVVVAKENL